MAPSVAIPTLVPLTVHAPEREAAERRAAEDATRAAHNVAIAAAVRDGPGGACFEIDKTASPMSRVRQKQLSTEYCGYVECVHTERDIQFTHRVSRRKRSDASLGGRLASSSSG